MNTLRNMFMVSVLFLHSHPQTAQDISVANVQELFQSLSRGWGCSITSQSEVKAEEASPEADLKSVPVHGKILLTLTTRCLSLQV